jgi:hypothetical protein
MTSFTGTSGNSDAGHAAIDGFICSKTDFPAGVSSGPSAHSSVVARRRQGYVQQLPLGRCLQSIYMSFGVTLEISTLLIAALVVPVPHC